MKQICAGIILTGMCVSLLVSCSNDDNPWNNISGDGGAIRLRVESDGGVFRNTRADDTKATIVPSPEEFGIKLSRTDGSSTKSWPNFEAFNRESSFGIGEYKLEASYGDRDIEGFTNPYYYASQTVVVTAGDEKNVSLTATLANCMVSVRYTADFNSVYPQHSAAVRSAGHDYVVFAGDETRPAYMAPGQMALSLTLTNSAGKQVTIQPAGFTAQPRRHYIVTIGVNGTEEQGNMTLEVQFEENVVQETVNVPLGDALFDAPAPTISARDFTPGETVNCFESLPPSNDPRFEVYAFGGLKEVNLTLSASSTYNSPFGNEAQLVNASDVDQSFVNASGIEVLGLYRNPDKMGIVKVKGLVEKLPIGTHTITLRAVDALTRESDPVSFVVTVSPVSIMVRPASNVQYMSNTAEVYVSTNCSDIKNKSIFTITQDDLDAKIINVETLTAAPFDDIPDLYTYHYKYTLQASRNMERDQTPVKLFYGNKVDPRAVISMTLDFPQYVVSVDAMAKQVKFKIIPEDPSQLDLIMDNIIVIRDGKKIDTSRVSPTEETGVIEVADLTAATLYKGVELSLSSLANPRVAVDDFTTESEDQIPNSDFTKIKETLNFPNVQVGGQFGAGALWYTIHSDIVRSEAEGWSSLNPLTCYDGAKNTNTWFIVPSTFEENGKIVIRSVGYSHDGTTPERSKVAFQYWCINTPTQAQLTKSIGELFLGKYTFNGTAAREDGISFASRPLSVTFDYEYKPVNNERGEVVVRVYDAGGAIISQNSAELSETASTVKKKVNLMDYKFGKKAAKLMVSFRSTSSKISGGPAIVIPQGNALDEGVSLINTKVTANQYHAFAKGSELKVDNVVLGY